MANMASVAYAIEGPQESLNKIQEAISYAMRDNEHWTEWTACKFLGFTNDELEGMYLGGEISEEPHYRDCVLRFYAEERWGLQDFEKLLQKKFPDIKVYWVVEESGCEVYCTNDNSGKYFPERFYCELCRDGLSDMGYFHTEEDMYQWLSEETNGKVHNLDTAEEFNRSFEDSGWEDENYISIHPFDVIK